MPQLNIFDEFPLLAKIFLTKSGRGRKWPKYWFVNLVNGFNRFLVPKYIGLEYIEALTAII